MIQDAVGTAVCAGEDHVPAPQSSNRIGGDGNAGRWREEESMMVMEMSAE